MIMADIIWVKLLNPVWSFLINCIFWILHPHKIKWALECKKHSANRVKNIKDLKTEMSLFEWQKDRFKDWRPWIITFFALGLKDDCDGASVLGRFLCKQIGIKGKIYHLRGKSGHAIFVSNDLGYMVTNNRVLTGKWIDSQIMIHFNLKYDRIIK